MLRGKVEVINLKAKVKTRKLSQRVSDDRYSYRGEWCPRVGAAGIETEFEVVSADMSGRSSAGFGLHITISFNLGVTFLAIVCFSGYNINLNISSC